MKRSPQKKPKNNKKFSGRNIVSRRVGSQSNVRGPDSEWKMPPTPGLQPKEPDWTGRFVLAAVICGLLLGVIYYLHEFGY